MQTLSRTRWYQEPWAWFNLVLLSVAVVVACYMTAIAMMHTPAELDARWYKEGVLAKQQKHEAHYIRQINLRGELTVTADRLVRFVLLSDQVALPPEQRASIQPDVLNLYIEHPSNPALDQTIKLTKLAEGAYSGQLSKSLSGKRHLLISPANEAWYLKSDGYFPSADKVTFTPNQTGEVVGE